MLAGLKVPRVPSWNESDENIAKKVGWNGPGCGATVRVWACGQQKHGFQHLPLLCNPIFSCPEGPQCCSVTPTPPFCFASFAQVTFVKDLPPVTAEQGAAYDYRYQTRAETLLAVDDMLEAVVQVRSSC